MCKVCKLSYFKKKGGGSIEKVAADHRRPRFSLKLSNYILSAPGKNNHFRFPTLHNMHTYVLLKEFNTFTVEHWCARVPCYYNYLINWRNVSLASLKDTEKLHDFLNLNDKFIIFVLTKCWKAILRSIEDSCW